MKKTFISQEKFWATQALEWNKRSDPSRPGRDAIGCYNLLVRQVLGRDQNKKAVVLGATPEIRDMLYKYYGLNKIQVICVDWLENIYYAMSKLVNYKIPNEKFVHKNWLEMNFPNNSIDIFIGDLILGNITSLEAKEKLLSILQKKVKKDGAVILRHVYANKKSKVNSVKKLLLNLSQRALQEEINIKQAATRLYSYLAMASWHRNNENQMSLYYFAKDIDALKKYFQGKKKFSAQEKMAKLVFDHFLDLIGDYVSKKYWIYYDKKGEEGLLKKYFRIQKICLPKNCSAGFPMPVYLLKKK